MSEEAPVENMIMYIPVAEATLGGTPMLRSRGLKIEPPPSPSAPETQPPKKEKVRSFVRVEPCKSMSDSLKPLP